MKDNYSSFLHLLELTKYKSCEDKIYQFLLKCDLSAREKSVGLDYYFIQKQSSLRDMAKIYQVTPERIRQILCKFIRLLMRPCRYEYLKATLDEEYAKLITERDMLEQRLNAVNMELRGYDSLSNDINGNSSIRKLEFSVRTMNILMEAGIKTVKELSEMTEYDLLSKKNCGKKSLNEIKSVLDSLGLSLISTDKATPR